MLSENKKTVCRLARLVQQGLRSTNLEEEKGQDQVKKMTVVITWESLCA